MIRDFTAPTTARTSVGLPHGGGRTLAFQRGFVDDRGRGHAAMIGCECK
jgi:hypothetical protein